MVALGFSFILLGTTLIYAFVIYRRLFGWHSLKSPAPFLTDLSANEEQLPFITVLVPVRNEEANVVTLLQDFAKLNYPRERFEVLIIDDHSTDQTWELVRTFQKQSSYSLSLIHLKNHRGKSGKKAAIEVGVATAAGEIILCTDGDCRVLPGWLQAFGRAFGEQGAIFVAGPVCFAPTPTFFEKMQLVEFAALVGVGAGSIALGSPNMCNGANIAYTKTGFRAVQGFKGNEQVASGDDEFLMHRLHRHYPGQVHFLKDREAMVYTRAQPTLRRFFAQRVRWASKWRHYEQNTARSLAILVFLTNLMLFSGLLLVLANIISIYFFAAALVIKLGIDSVFLFSILSFMKKPGLLAFALPLQIVYVPYVLITALVGLAGRYEWKGRKVNT